MSITFEPKGILKICFQILKEERLLCNIYPGFLGKMSFCSNFMNKMWP